MHHAWCGYQGHTSFKIRFVQSKDAKCLRYLEIAKFGDHSERPFGVPRTPRFRFLAGFVWLRWSLLGHVIELPKSRVFAEHCELIFRLVKLRTVGDMCIVGLRRRIVKPPYCCNNCAAGFGKSNVPTRQMTSRVGLDWRNAASQASKPSRIFANSFRVFAAVFSTWVFAIFSSSDGGLTVIWHASRLALLAQTGLVGLQSPQQSDSACWYGVGCWLRAASAVQSNSLSAPLGIVGWVFHYLTAEHSSKSNKHCQQAERKWSSEFGKQTECDRLYSAVYPAAG